MARGSPQEDRVLDDRLSEELCALRVSVLAYEVPLRAG